jgi:hypothetical protein
MDEFNCICGNIRERNFTYDYTMADGEVWKCNACDEDIIVEFKDE